MEQEEQYFGWTRERLVEELRCLKKKRKNSSADDASPQSQKKTRGGEIEQIVEDEEYYRKGLSAVILEEMYQFVGLMDPYGNMLHANTPALEGAGIGRKDVLGKPFWESRWWPEERKPVLKEALLRAKHGEFVRYEVGVWAGSSGNELVTIDFSLMPVRDKTTNEVLYILAEGRNIEEKKRSEEEVARKNKELRELYERVKEMDELKSQFFANISHELRTPLTLILGPTQHLLQSNAIGDCEKKDLHIIWRNAQTLLKHVNEVLDISKLEAGKMQLNATKIDFKQLVLRVAFQFESLASERNIKFSVQADGSDFICVVDSEKMQRCILNLLSNAFKFTPIEGVIHITLSVDNQTNELVFCVSDSGIGVAPPLREIIFERFRQAEGASTRKYGGTGLGLAIAKEFTELHNGTISVETAEEGGAKFTIRIPVGNSQEQSQGLSTESMDALTSLSVAELQGHMFPQSGNLDTTLPTGTVSGTILVVEDNAEMLQFVAESLAPEFQVITARNGKEGLEKSVEHFPNIDLILSDVMMPEMSGDELVSRIRKDHKNMDGIPIILLTAKADDNLRIDMLQNGAQDFLNKPFSVQELRARAYNLISIRKVRRVLQEQLDSKTVDILELSKEIASYQQQLEKLLKEARSSQEEAEKLNRVKDQFLMTVSHELRTPLTGIMGWAALLKEELDTGPTSMEELKKGFEMIQQCAENQSRITDDLLDISGIIAGKMVLRPVNVNLPSVISESLGTIQLGATTKNIIVTQQVPMGIPNGFSIKGDPSRLQQVLCNMLTNAIKFTPGGGRVQIKLEYFADKNPAFAKVSVEDTGIGIEEQGPSVLFQRFAQLESTTSRVYGGLGLGLAICRHIMELHGGSIAFSSPGLGKGSTFYIQLPMLQKQENVEVAQSGKREIISSVSTQPPKPQVLVGLRVLVVDDERTTRILLERILQKQGAEVDVADGSRTAMQLLTTKGTPDVVLSDISMPEEDGFALLCMIRKTSSVPVAAVTAHASSDDRKKILGAGFNYHLTKPLNVKEVISAVSLLSGRSTPPK